MGIPRETEYRDADKSLARPGRKQATATEDFDVHIYYHNWNISSIYIYNKTSIKRNILTIKRNILTIKRNILTIKRNILTIKRNILTIKKKINREVSRAKDLSAPRYVMLFKR
jgi:hypothetical protein